MGGTKLYHTYKQTKFIHVKNKNEQLTGFGPTLVTVKLGQWLRQKWGNRHCNV